MILHYFVDQANFCEQINP